MKKIHILHLYPNELNTYGDHGNRLVLMKRLSWLGFEPVVHYHHPGDNFVKTVDIVIGGGGQDSAQADVQTDILQIGEHLRELAESGVPMLTICGTYQLFGHRFITQSGQEVKGISIFDMETIGGDKRMIGNVMIKSVFGTLFGFENHSGQTFLGEKQTSFGQVQRGNGNNGQDKTEGARSLNVFGTYLHGPILPNNPAFCDELIRLSVTKRHGNFRAGKIDDSLAEMSRSTARRRQY